jgi:OOP family OmpA-OmpF porin
VVAAPVVQEVAPAPVYVAPPPPPKPRKVSFSADSLFEFNKSDIKSQGRGAIDMFASELKATDYSMITVSGHTDRIGTHQYNLDLSMRRAETVKNYLIQSGVPSDKIEAKGLDGDDPVTKPGDCVGTKATKALIACLQPDRRVDLEVTGTVKPAQ